MKNSGQGAGQTALGIIETQGRAPLIEAVDSAIKSAAVSILASYFVGGGCNTVTLIGDVGAMGVALDAARGVMQRQGIEGITHLIPRLDSQVWPLLLPLELEVKLQPVKKARSGKKKQ